MPNPATPRPARRKPAPDRLAFERALLGRGLTRIAGVDEAGRGPLAGPVVAAAILLPRDWLAGGWPDVLRGLNDSKQLSPVQRERFFERLTASPDVHYAIATVAPATIDRINILEATHRAMNEALGRLTPPPDHVLVDGLRVRSLRFPQTPLVQGDSRSYSIAAASILAKVTRDRQMTDYDELYPGYGFAVHKGYPTPQHLAALRRLGSCPIHRHSFAPLRPAAPELFPELAPP